MKWAFFLACSWTWCIGMFLPVLLVRNWGIWGWVVFAIPNVIGAAAMGWVIRSRDTSERILIEHRLALAIFSLLTVAFHVYFVYWFVAERLMGPWLLVIPVAAFFLIWSAGRNSPGVDPRMAGIVWVLSMGAFAGYAWQSGWRLDLLPPLWPRYEVLWLLPVCVVGFALCPYLDATFHRAVLASGPRAPWVFSLGFGVLFLCMIVFTLWYSRPMAALIQPVNYDSVPRTLALIIGCHMSIQSAFTAAVHVRELERMQMSPRFRIGALAVLFAAVLLAAFVTKVDVQRWIGVDGGEAGYWLFMSIYTLLAPTYVWVFMIPRKGGMKKLTKRDVVALSVLILVAGVLFWIAILHRQMPLLAVGLVLLVITRPAVLRRV
jgi:hypothetical protein